MSQLPVIIYPSATPYFASVWLAQLLSFFSTYLLATHKQVL
jgi:hypothetical protein